MINFRNDYSAGAHPAVLEALCATNMELTPGYGTDTYCQEAAEAIRALCGAPEAAVHFFAGGTQVNKTAIGAYLRPWEAVIAAETGHICVHETGSVEQDGHKVIHCPASDGKLTAEMVAAVADGHTDEFMVRPRMVYVSDSTELGTIYTKAELTALRRCCDERGLYLFLDGARLGSALTAPGNDLTLPDLAALTDAFYIGGTKNGALFGEALVFARPRPDFRWHIKRRGAMFAKGRLLGLQFQALLENGAYLDAARHANALALRLRDGVAALGFPLPVESPSNQQFPVFPNEVVSKLQDMGYEFEVDHAVDSGHTQIRLVTSWATPEQAVEDFLRDLAVCADR